MGGQSIKDNLAEVRARIDSALSKAGRNDAVTLVAVSKKQEVEKVKTAADLGIRDFGENYLQEAQEKMSKLAHLNLSWHFIGHLQTNKAKHVVGRFSYIQSLDRMALAQEISKRAMEIGTPQKCLIEINIAGEDSKAGVKPTELQNFLNEVKDLPGIQLCGLMVMPPFVDEGEKNRAYFRQAAELLAKMKFLADQWKLNSALVRELSMGTSQDFEVAVEEGATVVRLGTQLFGERK